MFMIGKDQSDVHGAFESIRHDPIWVPAFPPTDLPLDSPDPLLHAFFVDEHMGTSFF